MPLYMAPEILSGQKRYTRAVDVYSYAILCAVVLNDGQLPYMEYNFATPLDMQNAVLEGCRPSINPDCPQYIRDLLHQCWSPNVNDRPPFEVLVNFLQQ